ncbi:hypothetical protein [Xanthocytophaga flava]|uniref:hypothetical protein n=1 Tax=Xanthocytophaga flava TaxID=3048013 RepID=UPI0028D481E4|nr:hypothetical protein [Xanthocytophaga flavus]
MSALKYATFGGVFFWLIWLIDTSLDGKEISFYEAPEKLLIFLALFTVLVFIQISFSLVNKKYHHPKLIRKIRRFPAFVELELVKKFRFNEELNCFSGFYKGFELSLDLNLHAKNADKLILTAYVELSETVKNRFTRQKRYEIFIFDDAISISRKLPIFQPYNLMEESLDAFIYDLNESGAKNKVFEIIEDEEE